MTFLCVFVLSVIARSASDVAISVKIFALKTHSLPLKGTPSNLEGEILSLAILNFEPTLRSESRECLYSLPSREEETRVYLS